MDADLRFPEGHCGSMRFHSPHDGCPGTTLSEAWAVQPPRVESDEICVLVWEKEDHPVGYGADKLDEVYGPFGSWDEAHAFERGLQLPAGQHSTSQVLRLPKLSPHGVQPEDFRS